jgi:hypothetical protein
MELCLLVSTCSTFGLLSVVNCKPLGFVAREGVFPAVLHVVKCSCVHMWERHDSTAGKQLADPNACVLLTLQSRE